MSGTESSGHTESSADTESSGRIVAVNDLPERGLLTTNLPTPSVIVAVGAHPDDIEFGCGATLAKWADSGATIHHLVLTDGAKGSWDPQHDAAALVTRRQHEQRRAAALLGGGDVVFLGRTDGGLNNGVLEQWEVSRWIRRLQPDVVLGHDPWRRYRLHPDHRHAGFILTDAIVAARDPHFFTDQELPPHRPSALLLWEADEPNHVEDVAGSAETKIAALLAHESQFESTMGIEGAGIEGAGSAHADAFARRVHAQLSEHGALAGVAQGESFHLMTDI
jgi:LmbE family N-acetylglucosaminyl deacetylase